MPSRAFGQHQLGAERSQHLAAFERHRFRHRQGHRIAPRRRHERQRDSGIAAGRLDQFLARLQNAALFGVPDHGGADPAFHRIGRISAFHLGEHGDGRAVDYAVESNQRRAADAE